MFRKICPECQTINKSKVKENVNMWRCKMCGKDLTEFKAEKEIGTPVEKNMPETKDIKNWTRKDWEE